MKKIEAILKPFNVEQVKAALGRLGIDGMTLSEVKALERSKSRPEPSHHAAPATTFRPVVKIEVVVTDVHAPAAVSAVIKSGKAGRRGRNGVFVSDVEQVVRIRTEERDESAI